MDSRANVNLGVGETSTPVASLPQLTVMRGCDRVHLSTTIRVCTVHRLRRGLDKPASHFRRRKWEGFSCVLKSSPERLTPQAWVALGPQCRTASDVRHAGTADR